MNRPKTKEELVNWITYMQSQGYSVPCFINGGGFTWIQPDDDMSELADDEEYDDDLVYLAPGEEHESFRRYMTKDELDGVVFVRLPHLTGYNQENFDYQFGIYEI